MKDDQAKANARAAAKALFNAIPSKFAATHAANLAAVLDALGFTDEAQEIAPQPEPVTDKPKAKSK